MNRNRLTWKNKDRKTKKKRDPKSIGFKRFYITYNKNPEANDPD